jgi:hypothetical protein
LDTFESFTSMDDDGAAAAAHRPVQEDAVSAHRPSPIAQQSSSSSSEEEEPFSDAPSPVRAVLNRPWPSPVLIPSPSGKVRTLVATSDTIGPPITPEELDALEDKEGDDMCTLHYKAAGRAGATIRNYVHQHGSLYLDENGGFMIDHSPLMEEIRYYSTTSPFEQRINLSFKQCGSKRHANFSHYGISFSDYYLFALGPCETLYMISSCF